MTEPTALYRLYDTNGILLYIGIAQDPEFRWSRHAADKPWWPKVARKEVTWHPNRDAALKAEAAAIRTEDPRHNIQIPNLDGTLRGGRFRRVGETIALALSRPAVLSGGRRPATHSGRPVGRPKTGHTPIRNFRAPDDIWNAAKTRAEAEGRTLTDVINGELTRWLATPPRRRPPDEETGD